jgi:hypothetical protein
LQRTNLTNQDNSTSSLVSSTSQLTNFITPNYVVSSQYPEAGLAVRKGTNHLYKDFARSTINQITSSELLPAFTHSIIQQAAEDERNQIQDIARGMLSSQGFYTVVAGEVGAYASQAEKTLGKYNDGKMHKRAKLNCWGCSGNHLWMRKGKIVCPCGSDPQVIKKADEHYAEFKDAQAKWGQKPKGENKKEKVVGYKDLDERSKKKMQKTLLAIVAEEKKAAMTTTTSSASTSEAGPAVFMISTLLVPVFNITPPFCHTLPVPNQPALPHITLQLGSAIGCSNCPGIRCVVDTVAAFIMGNLYLFTPFAKEYPHTIASIHSPKDYSPITLSGIVQQGGASVTTDLTVGFQFNLPYLMHEGTPTSLVMREGGDVTVNIILGLPFITQTKMIIDTSDQVAKMHAFNAAPFQMDFRRAMCAIPVVNEAQAAANVANHANIVTKVKAIEVFMTIKKAKANQKQVQDTATSMLLPAKRAKAVNFANTSSTILIGSTDPMPYKDGKLYADAIHIDDLPTSV